MVLLTILFSCKERTGDQQQAGSKNEIAASPAIIEIILPESDTTQHAQLKNLLSGMGDLTDTIFSWKNHFVLYDPGNSFSEIQEKIREQIPAATVKSYDSAFYIFNRSHCQDQKTATEWQHILLTTNLVADTSLQQEYMEYHRTQFEEWPEVAKGFCAASFQQLLLFRNGRQLMLVISIPKGESLDALNPKTTENNPRVNEWNELMKKYQEGIHGTAQDEVWVFLQQLPTSN